jgi:hypothetical protein
MRKIIFYFAIVFLLIVMTACTSLMEITGRLLDGTSTASKTIETYEEAEINNIVLKQMRGKDGNDFLAITLSNVPNITFRSSMPNANGMLYITSYTFLCSSVFGWNEFTMDVSASGTFKEYGDSASLQINSPIEIIGISSGKIRYNNERLIDDSAIRTLNNRYERILALVEWMKTQNDVPTFTSEKDFQSYWKPFILPELVSAKKRPVSWSKEYTEWNRVNDINWNVSYTQNIFPEELHIYRNSGGLLRDWEESLSWIFLVYTWNDLCNQLNNTILLRK